MLMPIFFDDIIRSPAISFNRLIRCNILGDNLLNSFLVHGFYDSHPGKTHSIFICGGFDNHRGLLGPSSPFVSTGTAAKERIIDLNDSFEFIGPITVHHPISNLMQHCPGHIVTDIEFLGQLQGRETSFVVCQ